MPAWTLASNPALVVFVANLARPAPLEAETLAPLLAKWSRLGARSRRRDRPLVLDRLTLACYSSSMPRSVQTEKVSVSLKKEDLAVLRKRAKRLYGGNLSALFSDFARLARYEDGADKLVDWLTEDYKPGREALAAVEDEWRAPLPPAPKRTRSSKKAA